jgi:hypothetical protein
VASDRSPNKPVVVVVVGGGLHHLLLLLLLLFVVSRPGEGYACILVVVL